MNHAPSLLSAHDDLVEDESIPPRWELLRLVEFPDQDVLVLRADGWIEVTGITAASLHDRLQANPQVDVLRHMKALRDGGIAASDLEIAVHKRVRTGLWHGAFAAACLHVMPPHECFSDRIDADTILNDPHAVGVLDKDPNGPPYIALAREGARSQCLLMTWCREWQAFPGVFMTDALCPGETFFLNAFGNHMRAVIRLLGSANSLPSNAPSPACAN